MRRWLPTREGLLLDSAPSGSLLIEGGLESSDLWITDGNLSEKTLLANAAGETVAGQFDPSGSLVARLAAHGESIYLEVWDSAASLIDEAEMGEGYMVAWRPDSRFVIVAKRRPAALAFFDRVNGQVQRVPIDLAPQDHCPIVPPRGPSEWLRSGPCGKPTEFCWE